MGLNVGTDQIYLPQNILSSGEIICIIARMLCRINSSIGAVSMETAFVAGAIADQGLDDRRLSNRNIILLSVLRHIGFYRFINEKRPLEENYREDISHLDALYGYVYLKNMTPLEEEAGFLLFHDTKYNSVIAAKNCQIEYASLIFASEQIASLLHETNFNYKDDDFKKYGLDRFNPKYIELFKIADKKLDVSNKIKDGSCISEVLSQCRNLKYGYTAACRFLKMLIYIMDFKSTSTVIHTIHTACYAVSIGQYMGCTKHEMDELFVSGILHDIGKMAVSDSILESPGKLAKEETAKIKLHVNYTEEILSGIVQPKILDIAVCHHEKLNGKGYPRHLNAEKLSRQHRILTAADIMSALSDSRSYKGRFSKEKTLVILSQMTAAGELDGSITDCISKYYNEIQNNLLEQQKLLIVPLGTIEKQFQEELEIESNVENL